MLAQITDGLCWSPKADVFLEPPAALGRARDALAALAKQLRRKQARAHGARRLRRRLELPFWFGDERTGASARALARFERQAGVELPGELREALKLRDGGVSSYSAFHSGDLRVPIPAFFNVEELRGADRNRKLFGTPKGVVVIAGGGHHWLGLDYRDGPVPKVVFQEHEDAPIEEVAESFAAFLDGLIED